MRMGILMPCVAKHLLRLVDSMTPGNFLAEKTWKTSLKQEASTGAEPVLRPPEEEPPVGVCAPEGRFGEEVVPPGEDGGDAPTLTKFILRLESPTYVRSAKRRRDAVVPKGGRCVSADEAKLEN